MSLIKCKKCGEMYSDSYRTCPFCEEDESFYKGGFKKGRRNSASGRKSPSIVGPVLILVLLLVLGLVVWHFFGDRIFPNLGKQPEEEPQTSVSEQQPAEPGEDATVPETSVLEMPKTMQMVLGESTVIEVSGGTEYDWISAAPDVVTVNADGVLTAISEGTAIITVTDAGGGSAVCSVTVVETPIDVGDGGSSGGSSSGSGTGSGSSSGSTGTTGGSAAVDLSKITLKSEYGTTVSPTEPGKFDISMKAGDAFGLKVEGTSANIQWSTANSGVATMSDSGTLRAVGRGQTTITGNMGSSSISILVRVS